MRVRFALVGEGPTEYGLLDHLTKLCITVGATEASGSVPPFERLHVPVGHNLALRLLALPQLDPTANLYFVHRDADSDDHAPRYTEIAKAVADSVTKRPYVAIVPIHETEAWLLLDEKAIRRVAERPNGRADLDLPPLGLIEQTQHPKELLAAALLAAAQPLAGKRLLRFKKEFARHRQQLLEELPLGGVLEHLSAWRRLRDETAAAIDGLRAAHEVQP